MTEASISNAGNVINAILLFVGLLAGGIAALAKKAGGKNKEAKSELINVLEWTFYVVIVAFVFSNGVQMVFTNTCSIVDVFMIPIDLIRAAVKALMDVLGTATGS